MGSSSTPLGTNIKASTNIENNNASTTSTSETKTMDNISTKTEGNISKDAVISSNTNNVEN